MRKSAILFVAVVLLGGCSSKSGTTRAESKGAGTVTRAGQPVGVELYPVKIKDKYGYINKQGAIVLKPEYAGASRFSEGLAAVQQKIAGKVGYIDDTGKMIIPADYDLADPFSEGMAPVMKDRKWGYINKSGKLVIQPTFSSPGRFSEGVAAVVELHGSSSVFRFIGPKGDFIMDASYEAAMPFSQGLAAVRSLGHDFCYIDHSGKVVLPPEYTTAGEFVEGLAPVEVRTAQGMRWQYIGMDGKPATSANYTKAFPFSEGLAAVQMLDGKWGYINPKASMVITPTFEAAASFAGGLAQAATNQGIGYIDTNGKFVWGPVK